MDWILLALIKTFYESNIKSNRSLLIYGAQAWYTILSDRCTAKLESIHHSATRIIFPDLAYEDRLERLVLPTLNDFVLVSVKSSLTGFVQILITRFTHKLHSMRNVNHPHDPRLFLDQRYQRLRSAQRAFFNHLWDILISAISMLNERAIIMFCIFCIIPFSFFTRFFLADIEWQI